MKRTFQLLDDNIVNPNFKKTIDLCFENSSYFSFTKHYEFTDSNYSKKLDSDLNDILVKKIYTTHWYSYYMLDNNRPLEVLIYKATKEAKDIILNTFDNVFLQGNQKPPIAEDLCFFSNGELLLGTVSHEEICHLYPKTDPVLDLFLKYANWVETEYLAEELIQLKL